MQLQLRNNIIKQEFINIYKVYNLIFNSYNNIINRDNLNTIKRALDIQEKSVIIDNFNLYYFL